MDIPKRSKKKKVKHRLPNELIAIPCADKAFHERWYKGRNMLNFPHPWRGVFLGPPNCSKTTTIKNIILRAKPEFEEIFCIHCDAEYTKEWDDCEVQMLKDIPAPEEWLGEVKTLVILDDLEYKGMDKTQKANLDRLFGFVSTHKNISVALTSQDPFNVPPIVRRCANLWVLWPMTDIDAMSNTARKTGLKTDNFRSIFKQLMAGQRDGLWLDMTQGSPYPQRKNGYEIISKKKGEDSIKEEAKEDKFKTEGCF
jgi:hypothetical protein|tara:strand:+ start:3684 stop:4445 length:762 start_codon:yes stop_codon:yes gene_type:complete